MAVVLTLSTAASAQDSTDVELLANTALATLTGFTPAGGPPGTLVTITGSGFSGVTSVKFNGWNAASLTIDSDTRIRASVPGSATTGPISLTDGTGTSYSATHFFVGNAPSVGNFTPYGGAPGASITISGNYFVGITSVRFNGLDAAFTVNSTSQIVAVVPAGATTGHVTVSNPAGTGNSGGTFYLPPVVTSMAPAGAPIGTYVTVNGVNFSIVNQVQFNGVSAWFSTQSNERLQAQVPSGCTTGPLTVSSIAGSGSSPVEFFVGPAPVVNAFAPAGGPPGSQLVVQGSNFAGITGVLLGGVSAPFTVESATQLTATVPGNASTGIITVVNPAGQSSTTTSFYVGGAPVVTAFAPAVGAVGSIVILTGSGFVGASQVTFDGMAAPGFSVDSPSQITATVPAGATTGFIAVTNPTGTGSSLATFALAPRIVSFTPAAVPASTAVGTEVILTGWNLTGTYRVEFNGTPSWLEVTDDRHITTMVPEGATTGPIKVTAPLGTSESTVPFEVVSFTPPPHTAGAQWPRWPSVNLPVSNSSAGEQEPAICSDSTGGVYIVWRDGRNGEWDLYATRLTRYGEIAPGWPSSGIPVCTAIGEQGPPVVRADRVGGMLVAWHDARSGNRDIYATRISGSGLRSPGWSENGTPVCTAIHDQSGPVLTEDGAGGVIVAWSDYRNYNFDVYAQRLTGSGLIADGWPAEGLAICTEGSTQELPQIASDGSQGAYVAWSDHRYYQRAYLQRVSGSGTIAPGWPSNGKDVSDCCYHYYPKLVEDGAGGVVVVWITSARLFSQRVLPDGANDPSWNRNYLTDQGSDQFRHVVISDGQGGLFAVWDESRYSGRDIYAQRLTSNGTVHPGWPTGGLPITQMPAEQYQASIAPDGAGGLFVVWHDTRSGSSHDIYAHRIFPSGVTATGWPTNGVPIGNPAREQQYPVLAPGATGAIVTWQDLRSGASWDIYAQNIGNSSKLGNPEPIITSVKDLPNDQGGHVRIAWQSSFLDSMPTLEISAYGIWRQVDEVSARAALRAGASRVSGDASAEDAKPGVYRVTHEGAQASYWEGVGSVLARGYPTYTYVAETFTDSTAAGNPATTFMVDAHAAYIPWFWSTGSLAGYSVDNLPPNQPMAFSADRTGGMTRLHWQPNRERDFVEYRLYRGPSVDFVPDAGSLIATKPDTGYADPGGDDAFYKLVAIDVHGNASPQALVIPAALLDVSAGVLPSELALGAVTPNPVRSEALLRFALPHETSVRLAVFDAAGREVRTLVDGVLPAGSHVRRWDVRDGSGNETAAGVYFLRLDAEHRKIVKRLAVVR